MYRFYMYLFIIYAIVALPAVYVHAQTEQTKPAVCAVVGEHSSGEKSADVSAIQAFLVSRGYTLTQSGEFDTATVWAIKQLQTLYKADIIDMQGLTSAPGVWDIYTAMKARELVCGATVAPVPAVSTSPVSTPVQTTATAPVQGSTTQEVLQPSGEVIPERSAFTPDVSTPANIQQTPIPASTIMTPSVPAVGTPTTEPFVCLALELEPGLKHNDDVRTMQKWLISQGYNKVEATGNYGTYTKRAVAHFQTEYASRILVPAGLTKATGIWGERTAKVASTMGLCGYDEDAEAASVTETVPTPNTPAYIPDTKTSTFSQVPQTTQITYGMSQPALAAPTAGPTSAPSSAATTPSITPHQDATNTNDPESVYPGVCVPRLVEPGDRGADVRTIQRFLRNDGYMKVTVSGEYGTYTERAVKHYQEAHTPDILEPAGLSVGTGVWSIRTAIYASAHGLCDFKDSI